jgi:hypothetical protein
MSALLIGVTCKHCGKFISDKIKYLCGTEAAGFTCFDCHRKERFDLNVLGRELAEDCTKEVIMPGSPEACVICGRSDSEYQWLVPIDGRRGFICGAKPPARTACERKWAEGHRHAIGPKALHELKLK